MKLRDLFIATAMIFVMPAWVATGQDTDDTDNGTETDELIEEPEESIVQEPRTFTDSKGRTITATVVSATGSNVTIKRADGKQFTMELSKLSKPDQDFVDKWRTANPEAAAPKDPVIGKLDLEYRFSKKKSGTRKLGKDKSETSWSYEVELTNKDRSPIPQLTAKYEMFIHFYNKYADKKRGVARTEQGEFVIKGIEPRGRLKFDTRIVKVNKDKSRELSGDIVYSTQYEEDLEGIIIRFYQGEKKIGERAYGKTKRD